MWYPYSKNDLFWTRSVIFKSWFKSALKTIQWGVHRPKFAESGKAVLHIINSFWNSYQFLEILRIYLVLSEKGQ